MEAFITACSKLPSVVFYFLTQCVYRTTTPQQMLQLSASGHDLTADALFSTRLMFSGTCNSLLPSSLLSPFPVPDTNPGVELLDKVFDIAPPTPTQPRLYNPLQFEHRSEAAMFNTLASPDCVSLQYIPEWSVISLLETIASAGSGNGVADSGSAAADAIALPFHACIDVGALITGECPLDAGPSLLPSVPLH